MIEVVFDLETNSKYIDEVNVVHSLVIVFVENGKVLSCADQFGYRSIEQGLHNLKKADRIIAHNGICYDLEVIKKIFGYDFSDKIFDTLNASRLIWPNIRDIDYSKSRVPQDLKGKHSLEAWGYRLDYNKGSFAKETDWQEWSEDMQKYCVRDTILNLKLYELIQRKNYSEEALQLEFDFQKYINYQIRSGTPFNTEAAQALRDDLLIEKASLLIECQRLVPPVVQKLKTKDRIIPFNPNSRDQLANFLRDHHGWQPKQLSKKTNKPVMNEEVLLGLPYPEVETVLKFLQVNNILSKISEGKESWLNHVKDGKIHGGVITNGAITGRCTHSKPNLSQVTSPRKYMGSEARSLFYAPDGFVMVGADASGIELRLLAHYLHRYDGGAYAEAILDGDIHTSNQKAAELPTRDNAKTFIYAHNYGAGDAKLGSIVAPLEPESKQREIGKKLKNKFRTNITGLEALILDVETTAKGKGFLRGLDGRYLQIRETYRALNTLLQGGGAVVMKKAGVLAHTELKRQGFYKLGVRPVLNVHDEYQFIVPVGHGETVGKILVESIIKAGEHFKLNCPLDGEYKIGLNWKETH